MTFQSVSLDKHNYYRAKHDAVPLSWDRNCQVHAQNWANQLLRTNTFGHSSDRYCSLFIDNFQPENIDS